MDRDAAAARLEELKELINKHNHYYHVLDNPQISDSQFDVYMNDLLQLEKKFPDLKTDDSPSMRVGGSAISAFKQVKHLAPMLSLDNIFSENELKEFYMRLKKSLNVEEVSWVGEPKIDGLAVSLYYEEGVFKRGATRGDGYLWGIYELYNKNIDNLNFSTVHVIKNLDSKRGN